jgi:hypothetical protein
LVKEQAEREGGNIGAFVLLTLVRHGSSLELRHPAIPAMISKGMERERRGRGCMEATHLSLLQFEHEDR